MWLQICKRHLSELADVIKRLCRGEIVYIQGIAVTKLLLIAPIIIVTSLVIFPRLLHYLFIILFFTFGIYVSRCSFRQDTLLPNLIPSRVQPKIVPSQDELTLLKKCCPVCGKEKCSRHRPELNLVALQPWANLKIPKAVDQALEEFLTLVLKEHIYAWYRELSSNDEAFVDEVRSCLRFTASVVLRRLQKSNVSSFILNKIISNCIHHLHICMEAKKHKSRPGVDMQQLILDHYGSNLHCAVTNRRAELNYLKSLSEKLFPYLLPRQSLKCKGLCTLLREIVAGAIILPLMDVLADPDTVNNILLLFFDKSPPPVATDPPSPHVVILQDFAQPLAKKTSCLHLGLSDILERPQVLFPFMQFMKSEASVNVLQFYLSVAEFNDRILTPELDPAELLTLHQELKDLFRLYCDPQALDRIQFDQSIVEEIRCICEGPAEEVVKLQTSTPLFRAHEHAYELLQNTFLPLFHQSDDYYQMLCGDRLPTKLQRSLSSSSLNSKSNSNASNRASGRRGEALTLSKIGNKIKGVFRPSTNDPVSTTTAPSNPVDGTMPEDSDLATGDLGDEVDLNGYYAFRFKDDSLLRDLSAWRVTIPALVAKPDPDNPKRHLHSFVVDVRRVDVLEDDFEACNWTIERKYAEFYVLEQRLTEFHGDFEDALLPPKKLVGTRNQEFLESKRPAFEQYLQKLLTMPSLRGSELLYTFLAREVEFTSSFLPDINLGKMVKSGAMKLVKERGQHLDDFLQSLVTSTEAYKPRPCRWSDTDSDTVSISSEKMANSIFENNANTEMEASSPNTPSHSSKKKLSSARVQGVYDTIMYLADKVYNCPSWLHHILCTIRIIGRNTIDSYIDWYLGYKLECVMQEHRVLHIIHLIRDVLFYDNDPPRTEEDRLERRDKALKELKDFVPKSFVSSVSEENFHSGTELMFQLLQQPKLNKQLAYMLVDELIVDLFPELASNADADLNSPGQS